MDMNPAFADSSSEESSSETKIDPVVQKFLDLAKALTEKKLISTDAYDTIKKAVESCSSEGKDKKASEEDTSEMEDDDMEEMDSEDPRIIMLTKFKKTLGIPTFKKKM